MALGPRGNSAWYKASGWVNFFSIQWVVVGLITSPGVCMKLAIINMKITWPSWVSIQGPLDWTHWHLTTRPCWLMNNYISSCMFIICFNVYKQEMFNARHIILLYICLCELTYSYISKSGVDVGSRVVRAKGSGFETHHGQSYSLIYYSWFHAHPGDVICPSATHWMEKKLTQPLVLYDAVFPCGPRAMDLGPCISPFMSAVQL